MKHCHTCNQTKEDSDFYPSVSYKCKHCILEYEKIWRIKSPEKAMLKSQRGYLKHREERLSKSLNRKKKRAPNYQESNRLWRIKNRAKRNASATLQRAVSCGQIVRPDNCAWCGKVCTPVGHHSDYRKPLEVVWVCQSCHRRHHIEEAFKANPNPNSYLSLKYPELVQGMQKRHAG